MEWLYGVSSFFKRALATYGIHLQCYKDKYYIHVTIQSSVESHNISEILYYGRTMLNSVSLLISKN